MSAASFLHSSFLQAMNAVMLWPVNVQKVPQASEHVALPSCRPDVMSAALKSRLRRQSNYFNLRRNTDLIQMSL